MAFSFWNNSSRIRRKAVEIEPEEIFMDAQNIPGFRREMQEGRMERPIGRAAFSAAGILIGASFLMLAARLGELELVRGKSFLEQATANKTYGIVIQAPRGIFYDRAFEPLVENSSTFVISLERKKIANSFVFEQVLGRLAVLLGRTVSDIAEQNGLEARAAPGRESDWPEEIFAASGDFREAVLEIESNPDRFPGVLVSEGGKRKYLLGSGAAHALGYVNRPTAEDLKARPDLRAVYTVGRSGLEAWYEDRLRGQSGEKLIEVNARGEATRERYLVKASGGRDIRLELDKRLQDFASAALERHIKALGKKAGAVVAVDPRDGAVRALASYPAFDPNLFGQNASRKEIARLLRQETSPFFDRTISGGYPSASTIKPIMAAAALEEGIIDPARTIYDPGYISVPNPFDPSKPTIFKDWKALGTVDMRRAIAWSANVYFYTIGGGYRDIKGLGIERIRQYLERFGWGSKLGIDLPNENAGLLPGPATKKSLRPQDPLWRIGDTYISSIGQGDLQVTPLQLAAATAAIANGGTLWKPRLAAAILDENRNPVETFPPQKIRSNFVHPESLQVVREGMRRAVTDGSARFLADLPFAVAGKTGTAETGAYGKNHGWFTGFAPYEHPELVITVLVEQGTGGSTDAVPIAKEILYDYFTHNRGANE